MQEKLFFRLIKLENMMKRKSELLQQMEEEISKLKENSNRFWNVFCRFQLSLYFRILSAVCLQLN